MQQNQIHSQDSFAFTDNNKAGNLGFAPFFHVKIRLFH